MEKPDDLVVLDEFADAVSAYIVKGVLGENGIESVVSNELMSGLLPLNFAVGKVRLSVLRKELDEARRILEAAQSEEMEE